MAGEVTDGTSTEISVATQGGGRIAYLWNKIKEYVTGKLNNYYIKSQTYSHEEVNNKLGKYTNAGEIFIDDTKACLQMRSNRLQLVSQNCLFEMAEVEDLITINRRCGMVLLKVTGTTLYLYNNSVYTLHGKAENYGDSYADWEVARASSVQLNLRNNTYPFHIFWVYV